MKPATLTFNGGSSSLRFSLFTVTEPPARILSGKFERIGLPGTRLSFKDVSSNRSLDRDVAANSHAACLPLLVELLGNTTEIGALGHRLVQGGSRHLSAVRVDAALLEELRSVSGLAPNHLPSALALMEACAATFPEVPQIACFDTTFHHDLPRVAQLLPIPRRYQALGLRRYGFHGLSYAYLMEELARINPAEAKGRVILAHLGSGASLAAVRDGKSMDTTMGFTPASGLVMGTRSGDLDPGLFPFLARSEAMTATRFDHMANHESGLLGVSETSSDLRDLLAAEATDGRAAEAIALFCYRVKLGIGSYAAALGGLDTLVFAGGIGENAPVVRSRICEGLGFLGIELGQADNAGNAPVISTDAGCVRVRVIATDEEIMIAKSVSRALGLGAGKAF